jgi:hypothetical protein
MSAADGITMSLLNESLEAPLAGNLFSGCFVSRQKWAAGTSSSSISNSGCSHE